MSTRHVGVLGDIAQTTWATSPKTQRCSLDSHWCSPGGRLHQTGGGCQVIESTVAGRRVVVA